MKFAPNIGTLDCAKIPIRDRFDPDNVFRFGRFLVRNLKYKHWLALGALLIAGWPSLVVAEGSIAIIVVNLRLTCDPDQCRTPLLELHEDTGIDTSSVEYVFAPPPGIVLDDGHTTGVEVEGGGDTHYVRPEAASPNWIKCKWVARARLGAGNGLTRGYCWVAIKK
jgi:hypothetical protein